MGLTDKSDSLNNMKKSRLDLSTGNVYIDRDSETTVFKELGQD